MKKLLFIWLFLTSLAFWLSACSAPRNTVEITVQATEFGFTPERIEVHVGDRVRLTLQNAGTLEHDFSVAKISLEENSSDEHVNHGGHSMEGHSTTEMPDLHVMTSAGGSASIEFIADEAGEYQFQCLITGHKEAGMVGTLVVLPK